MNFSLFSFFCFPVGWASVWGDLMLNLIWKLNNRISNSVRSLQVRLADDCLRTDLSICYCLLPLSKLYMVFLFLEIIVIPAFMWFNHQLRAIRPWASGSWSLQDSRSLFLFSEPGSLLTLFSSFIKRTLVRTPWAVHCFFFFAFDVPNLEALMTLYIFLVAVTFLESLELTNCSWALGLWILSHDKVCWRFLLAFVDVDLSKNSALINSLWLFFPEGFRIDALLTLLSSFDRSAMLEEINAGFSNLRMVSPVFVIRRHPTSEVSRQLHSSDATIGSKNERSRWLWKYQQYQSTTPGNWRSTLQIN